MGAVLVSTLFDIFDSQHHPLKVAFIINGARKLTTQAAQAIDICRKETGMEVQVLKTTHAREAITIANRCAVEKFDVVIAVGGDGTVNEVLNGLMQYGGEQPILGVLPNGTGNDFVRGTDLILSMVDLPAAIKEKRSEKIDVIKASFSNDQRYFLNIADIGFGGKVVQVLDKQRRFIGGKASYAIAILRAFMGYRRPELEISAGQFNYKGSVLMVAICNGRIFGDGLTINPFAKMNDGKLNITLLGKVTLFDYVKNLKNLKTGKVIDHPEAIYLEGSEVTVRLVNGEAVGEMDGEYFPEGTCSMSVLAGAINLLSY